MSLLKSQVVTSKPQFDIRQLRGTIYLAKAPLSKLDDRYFFFSVDNFLIHSMPEDINMEVKEDLILLYKAISGFKQSFSAVAENIPFSIINHFLQKESWFHELFEAIKNKPSLFVHIRAPLHIIERRFPFLKIL